MARLAETKGLIDLQCGVPMVPRPPILRRPKRRKGAEHMVMLGETCLITRTFDGSDGVSFDVMSTVLCSSDNNQVREWISSGSEVEQR